MSDKKPEVPLSRRDFIKLGAAVTGGLVLTACGGKRLISNPPVRKEAIPNPLRPLSEFARPGEAPTVVGVFDTEGLSVEGVFNRISAEEIRNLEPVFVRLDRPALRLLNLPTSGDSLILMAKSPSANAYISILWADPGNPSLQPFMEKLAEMKPENIVDIDTRQVLEGLFSDPKAGVTIENPQIAQPFRLPNGTKISGPGGVTPTSIRVVEPRSLIRSASPITPSGDVLSQNGAYAIEVAYLNPKTKASMRQIVVLNKSVLPPEVRNSIHNEARHGMEPVGRGFPSAVEVGIETLTKGMPIDIGDGITFKPLAIVDRPSSTAVLGRVFETDTQTSSLACAIKMKHGPKSQFIGYAAEAKQTALNGHVPMKLLDDSTAAVALNAAEAIGREGDATISFLDQKGRWQQGVGIKEMTPEALATLLADAEKGWAEKTPTFRSGPYGLLSSSEVASTITRILKASEKIGKPVNFLGVLIPFVGLPKAVIQSENLVEALHLTLAEGLLPADIRMTDAMTAVVSVSELDTNPEVRTLSGNAPGAIITTIENPHLPFLLANGGNANESSPGECVLSVHTLIYPIRTGVLENGKVNYDENPAVRVFNSNPINITPFFSENPPSEKEWKKMMKKQIAGGENIPFPATVLENVQKIGDGKFKTTRVYIMVLYNGTETKAYIYAENKTEEVT